MEDLPLSRTAALVPELGHNTDDDVVTMQPVMQSLNSLSPVKLHDSHSVWLIQYTKQVINQDQCLASDLVLMILLAAHDVDEVMIWANNKIELEENLNRWHNLSKQYGLKINKNKTIALSIARWGQIRAIKKKKKKSVEISQQKISILKEFC